jgi:hypothetical protein
MSADYYVSISCNKDAPITPRQAGEAAGRGLYMIDDPKPDEVCPHVGPGRVTAAGCVQLRGKSVPQQRRSLKAIAQAIADALYDSGQREFSIWCRYGASEGWRWLHFGNQNAYHKRKKAREGT